MQYGRTDLALEAREATACDKFTNNGFEEHSEDKDGFCVSTIKITDPEGEKLLGKPCGTYATIELDSFLKREDNAFTSGVNVVANEISELTSLKDGDSVLIAGLGNPSITPDALGHKALRYTLATRHLAENFGVFRPVSLIEPGVLGTTGIESADVIKSVVAAVSPSLVIAIDALASRSISRLCSTVQISDSGIVPGSGIGNARNELSKNTLGVPVIAIGVPTVVDAVTIAHELLGDGELDEDALNRYGGTMIVTPKDIDANISDIARLVGYAVNIALHRGLTVEDVDMFVG